MVFPKKCNNGWLDGLGLNTDLILYNGPNLPCTGINFKDTVTSVINKINDLLCPEALTSAVLAIIQTNSQYNEQFCELVQACLTTTTTTSSTTSTSTTTTTTTAFPFMVAGALGASIVITPFATAQDACDYAGSVSNTNFYTPNGVVLALGVQVSQGILYFPFASGWYLYTYNDNGDPISPKQIFYLDINGIVTNYTLCP
jgi:hypothetical protein